MKTRIASMAGRMVVVSGLAAALAFNALGLSGAQETDKVNYFDQHPGPASGHTGVDPHDPYAPVDLGAALGADSGTLVVGRFTAVTELAEEWSAPRPPACRVDRTDWRGGGGQGHVGPPSPFAPPNHRHGVCRRSLCLRIPPRRFERSSRRILMLLHATIIDLS